MTKAKLVILIGFVIAFSAGLVVGLLVKRGGLGPPPHRPMLTRDLDLTAAQTEQMRTIWSGISHDTFRTQEERRKTLRKERDDAVVALMRADQKDAYEKIQQRYSAGTNELSEQRRAEFQKAVEQTKQILTETQRKKYDEMLTRWNNEGHGLGRRSDDRPSSRPMPE